jgi:hypothetical protein
MPINQFFRSIVQGYLNALQNGITALYVRNTI